MSEHAPTSNLPLFAGVSQPAPARPKSRTSIEAAASISRETIGKRREHVYLAIASSGSAGLARFQIAERLGVADHWITSSVDALIKAERIVECKDRVVMNPRSKKRCAVLVVTSPRRDA